MDLLLNVRQDERATTVAVDGEIDLGSGQRLLEYAYDVMRERGPWLTVDLAGVTFMDCGGISVLLTMRQQARVLGGQLRLGAASAPVRRVLSLVGMDTTLTLPEHRIEALA
jgi:anti-sigma B factor antagonist